MLGYFRLMAALAGLSFLPFFLLKEIFGAEKVTTKPQFMQPFSVKCYRPGAGFPPSCFFILSRGNNTGRPSYKANANCFVLSCAPHDLERLYWIVYALWYTGKFRPYLCGSVIPFIHIKDLQLLIVKGAKLSQIDQALSILQKFLLLETKLQKQLELIKAGRGALLRRIDAPAA